MYKRVDVPADSVEGFSYSNKCGNVESVTLQHSTVRVGLTGGNSEVYYEDIPNLILALKAAYDYNQGK